MACNDAAALLRQRKAGAALYNHLLTTYALHKPLSAQHLAVACHYASEAGMRGADFGALALAPGAPTGHYQRKVDLVIKPFPHLYKVPTPIKAKGAYHRSVRDIPMNCLHEALAKEVHEDRSILEEVKCGQWPRQYWRHPVVVRALERGLPLPLPLAIYLDGVRFTAPLVGRSDTILGLWGRNVITNKRHYLMSLRSLDYCQCGCRGWCTIYPTLQALAWSLIQLMRGRRSLQRHDGSALDPLEPLGKLLATHGEDLGFTAVLIWLQGDWSEVHHSLGLNTVTSHNCCCPFCNLKQPFLHMRYRTLEMPPRLSYEEDCSRHEVRVVIREEKERATIAGVLFFKKGKHGFGLSIKEPVVVNGVRLEEGDFLSPTPSLPDVMAIHTTQLPHTCVFWRLRFDFAKRSAGGCQHRNPVFGNQSLGLAGLDVITVEPADVLAIDSLHTVYFGPVMRWISAALWRILLLNPFRIVGSSSCILELGARRMGADMVTWFEENKVPHERRVGNLSPSMLGSPEGCEVGGAKPHPGCGMKYKAAETGALLPWTISFLQRRGQNVAHYQELLQAGLALDNWLGITRDGGKVLLAQECQSLLDNAQRHLLFAQQAGIHMVPKHHLFVHLSWQSFDLGNPKVWSCFLDEGLNLVLRNLAAACHRARQEERIFTSFDLLGKLDWSPYLYGEAS